MHSAVFLQDLAIVMIVAAAVTILFHRLRQPVVLGYILAGVVIGPHTPPAAFIHDPESINTLAELGVVFLMFALGLEFSLRKLRKVGVTALIAASLEILLMVLVGYEIGRFFGWPSMDCLFLGAMLSISSTTIIVKALGDLGLVKERFAELIFGILIVEDILAIVMIALLSGLAMTGTLEAGQAVAATARLGIFLVAALVVGLLVVPRLIGYVARFRNNELLLVTVLGLCFGMSLLAVKLEYSVALGAFVIGAVIAEAREIHRIEALTAPLRDMFSAVFFVAIGLLIEPALLVKYWLPIVVITLAVVLGKIVACSFGAFVAGNDARTSVRVGMGLAQIGEFSFIIASLGVTLKVTSGFLYPIAVTISAITTLLTPYLIRGSDGLVSWLGARVPARIVRPMALYTRWLGQWRHSAHPSVPGRFIRRWGWQMALNLVLVAGVFVVASYFVRRPFLDPSGVPFGLAGWRSALWLGAVLLSMPMLVATYRKLGALGLLLGELAAARIRHEPRGAVVRAVLGNAVPLSGAIGMSLFVLVLSAALLPSWKILLVLAAIVALVTTLSWRSLIRIYSIGQVSLEETFRHPPPAGGHEPAVPAPLSDLLREARIEAVEVASGSQGDRRMIRELGLRSRTGASIVAIGRSGQSLVNPGPDEELLAGDQVLLLGSSRQLEEARQFLDGPPATG